MIIFIVLLFQIIQCDRYIITSVGGKNIEVEAKAKTNVDHSLLHNSENMKANRHLEHKNRNSENYKRDRPKTSWDYEDGEFNQTAADAFFSGSFPYNGGGPSWSAPGKVEEPSIMDLKTPKKESV